MTAAASLHNSPRALHTWQLDAIRGVAAAYVVIHHSEIFRHRYVGGLLFAFGPEAVIVFFVLSGFVISLATEGLNHAASFREYFGRRFTRIYPLFLISLLCAYLARCIVVRGVAPVYVQTLVGNVLMLQDLKLLKAGTWIDTYPANDPLWSLSYEWWFYMAFAGLIRALRSSETWQSHFVLAISSLGTISYFIWPSFAGLVAGYWFIWWAGVQLSREFQRSSIITWRGQRYGLIGMGLLTLLWSLRVAWAGLHHLPLKPGFEPVIELRHFLAGDGVLLLVLLYPRLPRRWITAVLRPFVRVGEISYALYILHWPIFYLSAGLPARVLGIGLLVALAIGLEKGLQPRVSRWLRPLFQPRRDSFGSGYAPKPAA